MQSGRKAGRYISTKRKEAERQLKRELFYKYIPEIVNALNAITNTDKEMLDKKLRKMVLTKLKLDDAKDAKEAAENGEDNGEEKEAEKTEKKAEEKKKPAEEKKKAEKKEKGHKEKETKK